MTATVTAPARPAAIYRPSAWYRDAFAHLNPHQRAELRREYRHLRRMGVRRNLAKGAIYRTVNVVQCWD